MGILIQHVTNEPTKPITASELRNLLAMPWIKSNVEGVRACLSCAETLEEAVVKLAASGKDDTAEVKAAEAKAKRAEAAKIKGSLPGLIVQCREFLPHEWIDKKGVNHGVKAWRHQAYGVLNGLFMVDYDHIDHPREVYQAIPEEVRRKWGEKFSFVTPSGRGFKMVLEAKPEIGNLASCQQAFSKEIGLTCDEKCCDCSRLSFVSTIDDVLFLSDDLFTYDNPEYREKYNAQYQEGNSQADNADAKKTKNAELVKTDHLTDAELQKILNYRYHGHTVQEIIDARLGGQPPQEGDRHDTLLDLTAELRHVCEKNPKIVAYYMKQQSWVKDLQKEGDPVDQTISDAMGYKYSSYMPPKMKAALQILTPKSSDAADSADEPMAELTRRFSHYGELLEQLADNFPCLKEIFHDVNKPTYPSVLFASGALFGTLATRTWYYFYDHPEQMRRLNYQIYVIADPGMGKSVINMLYHIILSPIISEDSIGNTAINEYKKKYKEREQSLKEQKKDALKCPETRVRIHGTRTANGVFIEDMVNNVEIIDDMPLHLHLFTFDSELDSSTAASKGGQWIEKSTMELKAFHNEEDNQQYKNMDSVNGPFDVFWNMIYTGTPVSLDKKVNQRNFGTGLFSRLAVIPLCAERYKMMPYRKRSKENVQVINTLKEWAFRLDKVKGELPLEPLVDYTWHWCNDLMTQAREEDDKVLAQLIRRIPYYGINVSTPFILMRHWKEWQEKRTFKIDATDKQLCYLIMEIQLYSQQFFFGKYAENYFDSQKQSTADKQMIRYSKNQKLLDTLPQEFSFEKLIEVSQKEKDAAYKTIQRWMTDGYIEQVGNGKKRKYIKKQ